MNQEESEQFIFNALVDLEPVQSSEDGCDMRRFRSFNRSTCNTVLNLSKLSQHEDFL